MADTASTQQALAATEARYRGVFMSASDGFLVMDENDSILEANPAACTMHGYELGALVGQSYTTLIWEGCGHIYRDLKSSSGDTDVVRSTSVHRRSDGTRFEVDARACKFRVFEKERVLVSLTDMTLHNRTVQQLSHLSRKILVAQEEERRRLSLELHDELGQLLTAARLELGVLVRAKPRGGESVERAAAASMQLIEHAASELRRICRGLRPPVLDDLGLEPAVAQLVHEFRERTGLRTTFDIVLDEGPIPSEAALCVYRVLQESLNNISRHAQARSVVVRLEQVDGCVALAVIDDGKGFSVPQTEEGCGLAGMRERGHVVGGRFLIQSKPGSGTKVVLHVPVRRGGNP